MSDDEHSLRGAWDHEAEHWIAWARSRTCDHAFWRMNLPTLLELLPAPGGLTVDIACGEGRVARELRARRYDVVGVESSRTLARAAEKEDPGFRVHLADATEIPLPDGAADLAVLSLALMNVDDLRGVLREVGRVLKRRATLCFSIVHPLNSWGDAGAVSYFESARYSEELECDGLRMRFHETHRPLGEYLEAVFAAGFTLERLVEPVPDPMYIADHPEVARWRERPSFLHGRAVLRRDQADA